MPGREGQPGQTDAKMHSFAALLAPIALLLPAAAADEQARLAPGEVGTEALSGFDPAHAMPFEIFFDAYRPQPQGQVRVTQRVVIRITARPQASRENLLAQLPREPVRAHFEERRMGDCVTIQSIAGVQPGPENRLIFYMRDQTMVSAALAKECSARQFYSGFYVERSEDGKLCVKRDMLQSRAGASCAVSRLRQLVAVRD